MEFSFGLMVSAGSLTMLSFTIVVELNKSNRSKSTVGVGNRTGVLAATMSSSLLLLLLLVLFFLVLFLILLLLFLLMLLHYN